MAKKKRTKKYQGAKSNSKKPTIIHVSAVKRSKHGQWWYDNKKKVKKVQIAASVIIVSIIMVWLIVDFLHTI